MTRSLQQKSIWVTGASSGIGKALVRELAARGAHVKTTARREDVLKANALELSDLPGSVECFAGDVTDASQVQQIAQKIRESSELDILVANAGTYNPTELKDFSAEDCLHQMQVNYGGMVNCIDAVLSSMLERGHGLIAGVASTVGYRGLPRSAAYGASKAAQISFLESLRFHTRPRGVDVTIINPGFVKTRLTDKNDFPMPFLIEAEQAARQIADGLEAGKNEIHFPLPFSMSFKLLRILPYPIYDWIIRKKVLR